ncbi:HNH endonuclease [Massilia soli]|nr:HNH endonuclease [Massilia soli]
MWLTGSDDFARSHRLPPRLARYLQCTAEHLMARRDDGSDTVTNVVAACLWCNRMRHQGRAKKAPEALIYKAQVSRLVALRRWHPLASSGRGVSV